MNNKQWEEEFCDIHGYYPYTESEEVNFLLKREAEIRKETIEAMLPEDGIVRDELIYKAKEKFNITL